MRSAQNNFYPSYRDVRFYNRFYPRLVNPFHRSVRFRPCPANRNSATFIFIFLFINLSCIFQGLMHANQNHVTRMLRVKWTLKTIHFYANVTRTLKVMVVFRVQRLSKKKLFELRKNSTVRICLLLLLFFFYIYLKERKKGVSKLGCQRKLIRVLIKNHSFFFLFCVMKEKRKIA